MERPRRKTMRLTGYDYANAGAYHVTICTKNRVQIFGKIVGEGLCALPEIQLSRIGACVAETISVIDRTWDTVSVDAYVIMPNHIHLLLMIDSTGGRGGPPLHEVIQKLKSFTTHCYGKPLWQRSYHDHIIRCQQDYDETRQYIETNPLRWMMKQRG